jgi:hypothetical protein
VLRRIFGPKRDEVRKLHNGELRDLYSSPSTIRIIKSRRMRWVGHVARLRKKRNANSLLVGKPEGKGSVGRPRRKWVDNIRMDLGELDWAVIPAILGSLSVATVQVFEPASTRTDSTNYVSVPILALPLHRVSAASSVY